MRRAHRFLVAIALLVAGVFAAGPARVAEPVEGPSEQQVAAVHKTVLALDAHVDLPAGFATEVADPGVDGKNQVDLPKMERGGVDAAVFAVFAWQQARTPEEDAKTMAIGADKLAAIRRMVEWYPSRIGLARTADEVVALNAAGRKAAIIGVLNGTVLGRNAERLDEYYAAGLRQFGFVHASHNYLADSSRPLAKNGDQATLWGGLSPLGRKLVPRLNDLGIIIDVSQLSMAAFEQTLKLTRAPIIASHSGVKALVDTARNLTDGEMRAVAAGGGVVHIVTFSAYLRGPTPEFTAKVATLREKYGAPDDAAVAKLPPERANAFQGEFFGLVRAEPKADVAQFVDSIDYAVKLIGVDHVGIGTDFEHGGGVDGFRNYGEAANVTRELLRRGYPEADIGKIWSGNWLRVFREVERLRKPDPRKR